MRTRTPCGSPSASRRRAVSSRHRARTARGIGERRQDRLDLGAEVLVVGRERQALAQVLERLVGGEPGADGGDFEENAARLAEVDRLEVETVDDRGRMRSGLGHAGAPGLVLVHLRGPGDVMHGAGAGNPGLGWRLVEAVGRAARVAADLPGGIVAVARSRALPRTAGGSGRGRASRPAPSRSPGARAPSGSPDGRRSAARRPFRPPLSSSPRPSGSSNVQAARRSLASGLPPRPAASPRSRAPLPRRPAR